jgi:hypothetical protein
LHKTCEALRLAGILLDPREQPRQGPARFAHIRFHRSMQFDLFALLQQLQSPSPAMAD